MAVPQFPIPNSQSQSSGWLWPQTKRVPQTPRNAPLTSSSIGELSICTKLHINYISFRPHETWKKKSRALFCRSHRRRMGEVRVSAPFLGQLFRKPVDQLTLRLRGDGAAYAMQPQQPSHSFRPDSSSICRRSSPATHESQQIAASQDCKITFEAEFFPQQQHHTKIFGLSKM